jgi:hypothetical protein
MEAVLGIALYNYLYFKLANMLCLSHYLLSFLFKKLESKMAEQVLPGSREEEEG